MFFVQCQGSVLPFVFGAPHLCVQNFDGMSSRDSAATVEGLPPFVTRLGPGWMSRSRFAAETQSWRKPWSMGLSFHVVCFGIISNWVMVYHQVFFSRKYSMCIIGLRSKVITVSVHLDAIYQLVPCGSLTRRCCPSSAGSGYVSCSLNSLKRGFHWGIYESTGDHYRGIKGESKP